MPKKNLLQIKLDRFNLSCKIRRSHPLIKISMRMILSMTTSAEQILQTSFPIASRTLPNLCKWTNSNWTMPKFKKWLCRSKDFIKSLKPCLRSLSNVRRSWYPFRSSKKSKDRSMRFCLTSSWLQNRTSTTRKRFWPWHYNSLSTTKKIPSRSSQTSKLWFRSFRKSTRKVSIRSLSSKYQN